MEFSVNTKYGIVIFILCVALIVVFAMYGNIYRTTTIQCNEYYHKWIKENCMEYKDIKENYILFNFTSKFPKTLNNTNAT